MSLQPCLTDANKLDAASVATDTTAFCWNAAATLQQLQHPLLVTPQCTNLTPKCNTMLCLMLAFAGKSSHRFPEPRAAASL
jgi:hypothetical protein